MNTARLLMDIAVGVAIGCVIVMLIVAKTRYTWTTPHRPAERAQWLAEAAEMAIDALDANLAQIRSDPKLMDDVRAAMESYLAGMHVNLRVSSDMAIFEVARLWRAHPRSVSERFGGLRGPAPHAGGAGSPMPHRQPTRPTPESDLPTVQMPNVRPPTIQD